MVQSGGASGVTCQLFVWSTGNSEAVLAENEIGADDARNVHRNRLLALKVHQVARLTTIEQLDELLKPIAIQFGDEKVDKVKEMLRKQAEIGFSDVRVPSSALLGEEHDGWRDQRDEGWEIYAKRWDGAGWTEDERISFGPGVARKPSLAVDRSGRGRLVWRDSPEGQAEIYFSSWGGSSWSAAERLTEGAYGSAYPTLHIDQDGDVHMVWSCGPDGNYDVCYKALPAWCGDAQDHLVSGTVRIECVPSPFASRATIRVLLAETTARPLSARFRIFDSSGRRVREFPLSFEGARVAEFGWDGRDDGGQAVPAGVYFGALDGPGVATTRRLIRIR